MFLPTTCSPGRSLGATTPMPQVVTCLQMVCLMQITRLPGRSFLVQMLLFKLYSHEK